MSKCTGRKCPMQSGFKVEECQLGEKCDYYEDSEAVMWDDISGWTLRAYVLTRKYGLSKDFLLRSLDIAFNVFEMEAKKNETE